MNRCHWPISSSVRTKGERASGAREALGGRVKVYSGDKGGGLIEKQVRGEKRAFKTIPLAFLQLNDREQVYQEMSVALP